jgi:hypothetical protein
MSTPRLGAPELVADQAIPEDTVNEAFYWFDAASIGGFKVIDRDLATPPVSPAQGDTYLVAASATGAWAGHDGDMAVFINTAWDFRAPDEGWEAWVVDEAVKIAYSSGAWGIIGTFDGAAYVAKTGDTMTGDLVVPTEAYGAGWNGSNEVPTKNDVYDKIEALAATIPSGAAPTESFVIACSDENTALTTGTAKITFRMPYAFTLTAVRASLTTAQVSGSIFTVDINENGTSVLSTKLTIDNTEKTSTTAATAPVISDSSIADDAEVTIDIDQIGDGTAKGLKVYLIGHK